MNKYEMKLPIIIGIVAGVLVVQAVIIVVVMNMFFSTSHTSIQEDKNMSSDVKKEMKNEKEDEDSDEENIQFIETGRITTNAKASEKFVVVNLGLEFSTKEPLESGEDGENQLSPILNAKIKGAVNQIIGSLTVEEIHTSRDTLPEIFRAELLKIFKKKDIRLKDVIIQEFIIQ